MRAFLESSERVREFILSLDRDLKKIPPWSRYIGIRYSLILAVLETWLKQQQVPSKSGYQSKSKEATISDPDVLYEACQDLVSAIEAMLRHIAGKDFEYSVVLIKKDRARKLPER